jgi:2-polyprenyl-3-methyl-5-hydroxy-6-metoxy-1,4-benzoquinol methylase
LKIGPFVRRLFGSREADIAVAYRRLFIDLRSFARQLEIWIPAAKVNNILDLGCGEGMLVQILAQVYPRARITGIDITPAVGRLFKGDTNRVVFKQQSIEDFVLKNKGVFDAVVINDVMHHVPEDIRTQFLREAVKVLKPAGYLILKDWGRAAVPIHMLVYLSDRFITGDRVRYKTVGQWRSLIRELFGRDSIKDECRIKPWSNNIAFFIKP